jgi:hypothetical protein
LDETSEFLLTCFFWEEAHTGSSRGTTGTGGRWKCEERWRC